MLFCRLILKRLEPGLWSFEREVCIVSILYHCYELRAADVHNAGR